jgi:sugar phosphate isomerase/epimerase
MKISFSTLACPDWKIEPIMELAVRNSYDGIELRFIEGESSLWKLPAFSGSALADTRRQLADRRLAIPCLDTGCFFHYPNRQERLKAKEEGERMTDLAAALDSPGIRVFGDRTQPGATRAATIEWIAEGLRALAEIARPKGVEVWLETHGEFADSRGTLAILDLVPASMVGAVWDPANCMATSGERPADGAKALGPRIRHAHIKDLKDLSSTGENSWLPVLTGEGDFPVLDVPLALQQQKYDRFLSFEWEKKWSPQIADAEIAVPQFAQWWTKHWALRG